MRQTLELVGSSQTYYTDDDWQTVWKMHTDTRTHHQQVTDKAEADRIRYLALVQAGTHEDKPKR